MMQTAPMPSTKHCVFTNLDKQIWEFRFLKATNQAVDEWIEWQNYLKNLPPVPGVTTARMILDYRPDGPISMIYALQKNQEWRNQNQDIQPIQVKVAIVLKPMNKFQKGYADLLKDGVNIFGMRKVHVELFSAGYQQAIDWLLET